jgi:archaellum component FlaF (FlaF/FlaG flagellin family)
MEVMKRKGLSTIVGAVFMVIVMVGALNVTLWSMNEQERVTAAVTERANVSLDRLNEQIQIAGVRLDAGKLNMTIVNTGGQSAQLRSMYIINETAVPKQQYRYDLDMAIDGRDSAANIGQSLPFVAKQNTAYSVRVVTEAGVAASTKIAPVSQSALPMSLYVIPPTVTPGENVTLLYTVTNNSTDSYLSGGITPSIATSCTGCTLTQHVAPPSNVQIGKGTTGLFKWVYEVDGADNTPVTFNATISNAKQGNYAIETGRIEVTDISQQSFYTEIIISSDLVQKPEIFVIIPSPFGESAQQGLWGITIVNPTSAPMEVSRIVANIFTTHIQTNGKPLPIWDEDCDLTGIYPSTGWLCIQANQLEWKNTASPITIDALSAASFRARIEPSAISQGDEPAFITSITAFTSMGQFAKTGYSGSVRDATAPMTNVYMTDTTTPATALQNSHMLGYVGNIAGSSPVTLNVAFADLDSVAGTYIKSGTKLVVTIPKGFDNVAVASYSGFAAAPVVTEYTDGSTQVIATLAEHLGDTSSAEAKVLSITATTPAVPDERIFVLHSLVDGETESNFSVGSFAQIPLQVLP